MQEIERILKILKVASAKTISFILYPDSKNPHSDIVQTQKKLNTLVALNKIIRGAHWYAVNEYEGQFKEHDQKRTELIARLIRLKLPISVFTEVSFPIGIRSDLVVLIGKENKAICAVIEVANTEVKKPEYLNQKIVAWKNWTEAPQYLSNLFKIPIPHFSLVVEGMTHPLAVDFTKFMEVLNG
jgi:hypothetical protein